MFSICLLRNKDIYIVDVAEWSRVLNIRPSEWCCSVSMVWVQIQSKEEQNLTALKDNSNTLWFNFQTYIYIYMSHYLFYWLSQHIYFLHYNEESPLM